MQQAPRGTQVPPLHVSACHHSVQKILISDNVMIDFDSIDQINLFLVPLENNLLSMQMDKAFREIVLERDFSIYHYIARSILPLEHNYGPIQVKEGKGFASSQVLRILKVLEDDGPEYGNEVPIGVIRSTLLIDRSRHGHAAVRAPNLRP